MSNFAIGLVEAIASMRGVNVAAAAGTSANYAFNSEPGLIYRSSATVANNGNISFKLDLGVDRPIQMLGMFGIPAVAGTLQAMAFTSTANQDAGTPIAFNSNGNIITSNVAPMSTNRTGSAKALMLFNPAKVAYRYWTVFWYNTSGVAQTFDVSRVALCEMFQPIDNAEWGLRFEVEDTSPVGVSETGFDEVEEQRIIPIMSGVVPWGQVAELPYMRRLLYRTGASREVVASLDPSDTSWGEDTTLWGRLRSGAAVQLVDYDVNQLEFSVKAILP